MATEAMSNNGWQPIETAPRDQTDILVALWPENPTAAVVFYDESVNPEFPWHTLDGPAYCKESAFKWMPIPEMPPATKT